MHAPELPADESERLRELQHLCLLDTQAEPRFDRITRTAKRLFGVDFALISLVDGQRQWFKSNQGLAAAETSRAISFCGHAILSREALVVEDALADPRFADNPLVRGAPHIRFYAGVPLHGPGGHAVGTLCVIATTARRFDAGQRAALADLAAIAEAELHAVALVEAKRGARRSEARLAAVLDNVPDGILTIDGADRIASVNRAGLRLFGCQHGEALAGLAMASLIAPRQHAALAASLAAARAAPGGTSCELQGRRSDGRQFPLELSISAVGATEPGALAAIARDLSERRHVEKVQGQFSAIIECSLDAILSEHLDGRLSSWNPAAEAMFGYRAEAVLGQPVALLVPFQPAGQQAAMLARLGRGETVAPFETICRKHSGELFPVAMTLSPIRDSSGAVVGAARIARDITEQRRRQHQLMTAKRDAEQASLAKSGFLANMSHEIRTPLNAVLGLTYLLGETALAPDQRNYLDMIASSGQSLLAIVDDILDFSKIEAGGLVLEDKPFLLADVLRTLATIMSVNAGEKDLELVIDADPALAPAWRGDALRLQQVLLNLASNAIKFTDRGEVALLVEAGADGALRFTMRDSGIGISAAQQARLFSPFTQADNSITRQYGGTGLGLSIARRLATLMGGALTLSSEPGRGSEFCLSLPLTACAEPAESALAAAPLRVLLVDDSASSRASLARTLAHWQWPFDAAASAVEAQQLLAAGRQYDLLLVDWQMAGQDGMALLQAARARPGAAMPLSLLMVSAFGRGKLLAADTSALDTFLTKPVTAASLLEALEQARARRQGAASSAPQRSAARRLDARLLLVEDNPLNQVVARTILAGAGASVEVAGDGAQALAMLRERPEAFQLVLMDVQMPVLDGISATRAIRQELGLSLPVLAMTAGVLDSERAGCLAAGMSDFIAKPINVAQMLATIARHLPGPYPDASAASAAAAPAAPAPAPAPAPASCFDVEQLLAICEGDPDCTAATLDVIARILDDGRPSYEAARAAWQAGNGEEAAQRLHTLRGTVGALGAERFVGAVRAIEQALKQAPAAAPALLAQRFEAAQAELDAALAAGHAWLARQAA